MVDDCLRLNRNCGTREPGPILPCQKQNPPTSPFPKEKATLEER